MAAEEEEGEEAAPGNKARTVPSRRSGASVAVAPRAGDREVAAEATLTGTISAVARMNRVALAAAGAVRTAGGAAKTGARPETCRPAGAEAEAGHGRTSGSRRMASRATARRGGRQVTEAGVVHSSRTTTGRAGAAGSVAGAVGEEASCHRLVVAGGEGEAV